MPAVKRTVRPTERPDPEGRPIDGQLGRFELVNPDPAMDYRWVGENGQYDTGYYESAGWQIVLYEEGGACPVRGGIKKSGQAVQQQGQVLMERPKEAQKQDWAAGQADMDKIDQQIHNTSYGRHQISKIGGLAGYVDVINSSTPARAH